MNLNIKPFSEVRNLSTDHLVINLTQADFANVQFVDGRSVLPFFNCAFEKLTILNNEEISFKRISLDFFNCFIQDIQVDHFISQNISIGFYGSFISGVIKNSKLTNVDINNCLTPSSLFLIDVSRIQIRFTKENFEAGQWNGLFIQYYFSNPHLLLENAINFNIHNPTALNISSNFEQNSERFKPNVIVLYEYGGKHKETIIKGATFETLSMSGNCSGNISIENAKIKSWYIHNFTPIGNVSFYSIGPISLTDPDNRISFHNSKLDSVEFDNVEFDSYPIISFFRTKFSKAIFTSCNFPEEYSTFSRFVPIENVHYPDERPKNYAKAQYEIFLQLKRALEDRGNYYEAQKLQAISHEALRQIKSIPWFDRTILNINNWSNSHGLSVKRPLVGFAVISIPLYLIYLLSINRIFNDSDFDPSLIGYYFSFIDITHRVDFLVEKSKFSWWTPIIDYLGKIIVGFFIYQFIAAFRKYGKK